MDSEDKRSATILLIEDSPTDVLMTREALAQSELLNRLEVVNDGVEAMAFLLGQKPYEDAPRPDLILLDLNMPRKDGREVLSEIKSNPDLKTIPVVVLTTSSDENDILRSYGLHANSYLVKPMGFDEFMAMIRSLEGFWFEMVTLPPNM
jgi:two-component system, chemotaxis family, response regulator Rcp1